MLSNTTGLYMTGGQILAMAQSGHEIASHTKSHPALISLSSTQSFAEVTESKNILESMWLQIRTFVYPLWSTNDTIEALIQNGWYAGARGDIPGFNTRATNRWNLYSQSITSTTSINTIKSWIDIAFSKKQWLILEIHRQDINGWEFSNDPALIGQIVAYIQSKNMKTVTLAEGIDLLNP
jgi:peptidoglycan/xylan/chitin deacetylase (PgdA/CDA1 family)